MKKCVAIMMTLIMMFSCLTVADARTISDLLGGAVVEKNIATTAEISVKSPGASAYVDSDVTVYKNNSSATMTFGFDSKLNTTVVKEHFNAYIMTAKALCGSDAQALADLNALPVTGQFTINIRYPKVLSYNNSLGYFDEGTLALFEEVSRTQVEDGNFINATVVTKVKDGITAGILEENVNNGTYLNDVHFIAEQVSTDGVGKYTVEVSMSGATQIGTSAVVNFSAPVTKRTVEIKVSSSSGSTSGNGSGFVPTGPPVPTPTAAPTAQPVEITIPDVLVSDHVAYIIGYPGGNINPNNNITRAEVTTIFYRLLKPEIRNANYTKENSFSDVIEELWSNEAISTMANANYINGYEDGTCKPQNSITRAEFVQIAANLYGKDFIADTKPSFSDIGEHWGTNAIELATNLGWITGYDDGTFKPDQYITRAEAMAIVNRMTGRFVEEGDILAEVIYWPDNPKGTWYYCHVCEATNTHTYTRKENNYEIWTSIVVNNIVPDKQ